MRAILICPDETLRSQFEGAVAPHPNLVFSKILSEYPSPEAASRLVRAWVPQVIFMSVENEYLAEQLNRRLENDFPAVPRIAIHSSQEPSVFRFALRLRMQELLVPPFENSQLTQVLTQIEQHAESHPFAVDSTERFYAFVPAKAGVGASTIAANATWAFSRMAGASTLLADFDMYSGVTGFMFNVEHEFSVADAVAMSKTLDDDSWQRVIKKVGNIDLLLSDAPQLGESFQNREVSQLIEYARRNYSVVNADLPDTLDNMSLAVLRDASRIFLVVTPELAALRLARLKALVFRRLDMEDKVSLVVNRVTKRMELSIEEIEKTVGLPVFATFPCEYADVIRGIRTGQPSAKMTESFRQFAEKLLDKPVHAAKRPRFIERFAMVPMKYGFR
jgi:pilus assembly protein CpaE